MVRFNYSDDELDINKVLKMNQEKSKSLLNDKEMINVRTEADKNIESSLELLRSINRDKEVRELSSRIEAQRSNRKLEHRPVEEDWNDIVNQANLYEPYIVNIEDIISVEEINDAFKELDEINRMFSEKTGIVNKVDLSFLTIATVCQVIKTLLFPYVAEKFGYGDKIDKTQRLDHNDKSIEEEHRRANDKFRDKYKEKHGTGYWINILYQTPPFDITTGSAEIGINMGGAYHRLYTMGHDPVLGWIFGTMNILTDVVTLNNFRSYRVLRKPKMRIISERVPIGMMFNESYECVQADFLNLPAAVFAQAQHLKSDQYTKLGLPVPLIATINEGFASKLYKSNYDSLCLARDSKIIGGSFVVSRIIDSIIILMHGLFRTEDEPQDLYEVRTRKILLISNAIASTSSIILTKITANPKNLDLGGIISTVVHLFSDVSDVRFIAKIKEEFVYGEISDRLKVELLEVEKMFDNL